MGVITKVTCRLVSERFGGDEQFIAAHGTSSKRDECLVLIETEEGRVGIGEAYHAFSPTSIAAIVEDHLADIVVGRDAEDIQLLWEEMFFSSGQLGSAAVAAISGIDIALWDLLGRATGRPIAQLLGAGGVRRVPAYVGCMCLGWQDPVSLKEEASEHQAKGFGAMKVRGGRGMDADLEAVAATREAVGPDVDLMVDANSAYSPPESLKLAKQLSRFDVFWLEDPFDFSVAYHHSDMGWLRERSEVPIASGGNVYTRFDVRNLIECGGVDYLTPDATKCGGISEAVRIASIASAYNITVAPHTVVGVGTVAGTHFTAAIPSHIRGHMEWDASADNPLRDELTTPTLTVTNGAVVVPEGPGLGIDIPDDQALDRFSFVEGREISMPPRLRRWDPNRHSTGD